MTPQPAYRQVDGSAADLGTLIDLGLAGEQPQPPYEDLFLEPDLPPVDEPE
ncbi:hypothetical protein ACIQH0_36585 [Streptomyces griseus]|nr:hypothetical protein [Streptomyces griseus]